MSQKTTAQLKAEKDANITSNGTNSNTGENHNTFLENLLDSILNKSTDALSIVTNVYRAATVALTASEVTVTFSTPLVNANYQIFIIDNDGVGWENITAKTTDDFKITGLSVGNVGYLVILNN